MKAITTENAPAAVGPYSQAIVQDGLVFASGQIPLDPATGEMIGDDAPAQAHQVMKNLAAVLAAAGTSLARAVRTTIYLTDIAAFAAVNEVYASYLAEPYPARATVQVAALPKGALVEIDCVAIVG